MEKIINQQPLSPVSSSWSLLPAHYKGVTKSRDKAKQLVNRMQRKCCNMRTLNYRHKLIFMSLFPLLQPFISASWNHVKHRRSRRGKVIATPFRWRRTHAVGRVNYSYGACTSELVTVFGSATMCRCDKLLRYNNLSSRMKNVLVSTFMLHKQPINHNRDSQAHFCFSCCGFFLIKIYIKTEFFIRNAPTAYAICLPFSVCGRPPSTLVRKEIK